MRALFGSTFSRNLTRQVGTIVAATTLPQIILLKEGTDVSQGKAQLISNNNACIAVVDVVRTTLGPRGTDKLVHDDKGTTLSNDGATIMKLLDIVHPGAKILVDIAKSQDSEVGDGKLVFDGKGTTLSNDGATIMKLLDIVHPGAKILVDIAKSQDSEVGDDKLVHDGKGTTLSNDGATIMKLLDIVHPGAKILVDIAKSQDSEIVTGKPHRYGNALKLQARGMSCFSLTPHRTMFSSPTMDLSHHDGSVLIDRLNALEEDLKASEFRRKADLEASEIQRKADLEASEIQRKADSKIMHERLQSMEASEIRRKADSKIMHERLQSMEFKTEVLKETMFTDAQLWGPLFISIVAGEFLKHCLYILEARVVYKDFKKSAAFRKRVGWQQIRLVAKLLAIDRHDLVVRCDKVIGSRNDFAHVPIPLLPKKLNEARKLFERHPMLKTEFPNEWTVIHGSPAFIKAFRMSF